MQKIKVLIADDHIIMREGLRVLLETQPDIEVVGEATDGTEAVSKSEETRPDVVLMDISMPGTDGLQATQLIKQQMPEVKVLVLTMHESDGYFFKVLDAGAAGYFIKGGSSSELISAIKAVAEGNVFLHPTMAKKLLGDYLQRVRNGQDRESYDGLTKREREVLKLIADGHTNQKIADLLVLSVATVQTHRAHIMSKLRLHSPADLVKYAVRRGLTTVD